LMERECYEHFLDEKCWKHIDVLRASLSQTVNKDGFVELPTLSALLHAPTYGPLIMETLKGTEKYSQMKFLIEVQDFYSRFMPKPGHRIHSRGRKEMTAEARRIYETYVVKTDLEIPKRVKNEIARIVHAPTGKMTPTLFQTAGAWVFNRISQSWIREVNSLFLWADHDFDNNSHVAKEMDAMFDMSIITANTGLAEENLHLVPHPDDVMGNPSLFESFAKYIPADDLSKACLDFVRGCKELVSSPPEVQAQKCGSLVALMTTIAKAFPELSEVHREIMEHVINEKESFNPFVLTIVSFVVSKILLSRYYSSWLAKSTSLYKHGGWVPVKSLTFVGSDAIPGTSWIPTVGLPSDLPSPVHSPPPKMKWSLLDKLRNNSSGGDPPALRPTPPPRGPSSRALPRPRPHAKEEQTPIVKPRSDTLSSCSSVSTDDDNSNDGSPTATGSFRLPSSVPRNVPAFYMEIPSLKETLTSSNLRRLFFATFLEFRLSDDEKKVWSELSKFQADFGSLTDAEFAKCQKEIRAAAIKVLEGNPDIPDHDALLKVLRDSSSYPVSSRFFMDAETKLYGKFHDAYQSFLANNQWLRV